MTKMLRSRHLLLATGMSLLLGACGAGGTPAATSAPNGTVASAPTAAAATSDQASNPVGTTGATSPGTGGIADPCSLLTQADVEAALGQSLGPGKSAIARFSCAWSTSDFAARVHLTVGDWGTAEGAAPANGGAPSAISGLGDEAWTADGNNGLLLYARKGGNGFLLIINGPNVDSLSDHGLAHEKVLAAAILARL